MKVANPINMERHRRRVQEREGTLPAAKQDGMADPAPGSKAAKLQEKQKRRGRSK